ncbi:hypothetical protein OC846_005068 [Tilletia horrida]|uniref:Alpha/beta hydrolase fold-3 domain-containing protein n=1 Tax=Tilletia horrida TaxID=155126 RepID=A0AAN6GLK0_9BASI|nr:hypothetical protein OC845_004753 [Tilletia horrida]KAK0546895.1 hypothetical protein OC846_005068 [Tilletia horrida]KAK0567156.1 hypothetical protein OC861_002842 [Tilletia horrida]
MTSTLVEIPFKTFQNRDGTQSPIHMDVHIPPSATPANPAPVLLWWHGGALVQGSRKGLAPHFRQAPQLHNICVVAPDYRLAPQVRFPTILTDVVDALNYLATPAFAEATDGKVDTSRIILAGSSAGGWLALLAGTGIAVENLHVRERIKAIAAIYPMSTLNDSFWTTKQRPLSYAENGRIYEAREQAGALDEEGPIVTSVTLDSPRGAFFMYITQEAILPELLLKGTNLDAAHFGVPDGLRAGLVESMPPTFIIHGDADDKVPIRQATQVVDAAHEAGFKDVIFETAAGQNHMYDLAPDQTMDSLYTFVNRVLVQ